MRLKLRPLVLVTATAAVLAAVPGTATADPRPTALLLSSYLDNYRIDPVTGVVTPDPVVGMDVVPSPKGDRIAYTKDVVPCVPYWDGSCNPTLELVTADPDGTDERLVFSGGTESTSFSTPDWSPDGKQILFTATSDPGGGLRGIAVVNVDGTGLRSLDRLGYRGTFSPDGKEIAYVRGSEVWVVNVATGASRAVTAGAEVWAEAPDWSPDGKRIAFTTSFDVLTVSPKGGPVTTVIKWGMPFSISAARTPVYSPDGTQIAFAALLTDPNDPMSETFSGVLILDVELGDPHLVARQWSNLTDWVRTG